MQNEVRRETEKRTDLRIYYTFSILIHQLRNKVVSEYVLMKTTKMVIKGVGMNHIILREPAVAVRFSKMFLL